METMNIAKLYREAEQNVRASVPKGEKAEKIRDLVLGIGKSVGKSDLLLSATLNAVKTIMQEEDPTVKLDRSYFQSTIERRFETSKDDQGRLVIHLDRPKISVKQIPTVDPDVSTSAKKAKKSA